MEPSTWVRLLGVLITSFYSEQPASSRLPRSPSLAVAAQFAGRAYFDDWKLWKQFSSEEKPEAKCLGGLSDWNDSSSLHFA
jgi:hypothetical protein